MGYSSGARFSRAKPTGSFRVLQASTRRVASHDETLKDARKSAAYWTSAVGSPMEIQERFPSGTWTIVETVQPKRAHAARKTHREMEEGLYAELMARHPIPPGSTTNGDDEEGAYAELMARRPLPPTRPRTSAAPSKKRAHATARKSIKPGDTVRVTVDTHGGFHPLVGERGYYADVVRDVQGDQVILTHVSWAPVSDVAPTTSPDALVTFRGRPAKIRMLDRGKIWWAMLPRALEPLATGKTYEDALRKAVTKLH
jgi:hypothetical protein